MSDEKKPSKIATCKTVSMSVIITAIIIACITALIVGIAVFLWQDARCEKQKEDAVNDATQDLEEQIQDLEDEIEELQGTGESEDTEDTDESEDEVTEENGHLKGSLGYPSEFIPEMKVYAQNLNTGITYSIATSTNQLQYQLDVPAGSYYVYAMVIDAEGTSFENYRAYYSEFVTCGMTIDCDSHDPITVTVASGETKTGVDPIDWYNY
jgi:TolA-binding protein